MASKINEFNCFLESKKENRESIRVNSSQRTVVEKENREPVHASSSQKRTIVSARELNVRSQQNVLSSDSENEGAIPTKKAKLKALSTPIVGLNDESEEEPPSTSVILLNSQVILFDSIFSLTSNSLLFSPHILLYSSLKKQ